MAICVFPLCFSPVSDSLAIGLQGCIACNLLDAMSYGGFWKQATLLIHHAHAICHTYQTRF